MEKLINFLKEFHDDSPFIFWFWFLILGMVVFLGFIGLCGGK